LSTQKVDYSELIDALESRQNGESNKFLDGLTSRTCDFLQATMDASRQDAEDAVQEGFLMAYEKFIHDELKEEKFFYKYLLTCCRNAYLKIIGYEDRSHDEPEHIFRGMISPHKQIANLLNKDRQQVLQACLEKLKPEEQEFITYLLNNPDKSTKEISKHTGLSESNVRVKKSRIIDDLSYCAQKKMEQ
jgi:RNA polymerase sigma factor (sigma-70 family)